MDQQLQAVDIKLQRRNWNPCPGKNMDKSLDNKRKRDVTLAFTASESPRAPSNALVSNILSMRCPSKLAKTLIPLSLVVTASNEPSLLNLNLGLA